MGENFVNYQVRSDSISNVVNVVKKITKIKAYVSPSKNGWITVYDQSSEEFKSDEIYYFAQQLSFKLSTTTLALIVNSRFGYNFIYLLYEYGQIVDEFFDNPEDFEFDFKYVDNNIIERFKGNPQKLIHYCTSETVLEELSYILESCREKKLDYTGQDAIYQLAPLLELDEARAVIGFRYFEDDNLFNKKNRDIEDAEDFILVKHQ